MEKLKIVAHVHFGREKRGKRRLLAGRAPQPERQMEQGNIPRLARLMALAIHFEGLLARGEVKDMAELARLGHVTRARITQIMNLRLLAADIQEALLDLPRTMKGRDRLQYRHVQPMTVTLSWGKQREMWAMLDGRFPAAADHKR
ncbi:MAG TPA: hypothetical protein PLS90_16655 [Candidatus Sumerlaeota bacterium]|nr:MAG: hypothetical protein BWZ08_01018 [candidate division BRC1 bacterium ADurb.BinA292]HOR29090.1 hypothetical protein [Candidatus Sumerlaeota bacterium]HPK04077.1 hypothetical protein [Candidatus Sumerlaeota bacterium]